MFEWNDDDMYKRTIALKKKNPELVISLAVGGWNHEMGRKSKKSILSDCLLYTSDAADE